MAILITGGAGYIGSHTVHYLVEHEISAEDIVVFDNLVYGHEKFIPSGVKFVKGDLLSKVDIQRVFSENSIDTVIHFAAYAYVGESMEDPGKYFENNVYGGLNLLEAMVKYGCKKIIFSSTCATYGIPNEIPITEKAAQMPINPYGESKLMFEKILEWYHEIYGVKSIRLRYFNAAGAGFGIGENHIPETHLIPLILDAAKDNAKNIKIFGDDYDTPDGTCIRDYIHVVDLADAHFKAMIFLDNNDVKTNFFNIGTGNGTSVLEVINAAKNITHKKIHTVVEGKRSGDPAILVADPQKANEILGWRAKYGIDRIVGDAWEWHANG